MLPPIGGRGGSGRGERDRACSIVLLSNDTFLLVSGSGEGVEDRILMTVLPDSSASLVRSRSELSGSSCSESFLGCVLSLMGDVRFRWCVPRCSVGVGEGVGEGGGRPVGRDCWELTDSSVLD